jgi:DNA topoisomerase III
VSKKPSSRKTAPAADGSGKTLVIAEKPSVAGDLAKVLKVPKRGEVFEDDRWVITSAVGHLVELREPHELNKDWKGWTLASLPILPGNFLGSLEKGILRIREERGSSERFHLLRKQLQREDVASVVNACDAGREGELIFHMICTLAGSRLPERRLWLTSMTPAAIRESFDHLLEPSEKAGLRASSICRSQSDWLMGLNLTRCATKMLGGSRISRESVHPVGRVQTPTLMLIVRREHEIRNFVPRAFWKVEAEFRVAAGAYRGAAQVPGVEERKEAERFHDEAQARAVAEAARALGTGTVSDERKPRKESAPRLLDLTTLQREANRRFGFAAKTTLGAAQSLYERHKALTYPRTDSSHLPEDYVATAKEVLASLGSGHAAGPFAREALAQGWVDRAGRRVFDNAKVSDHFAIVPTGTIPDGLSDVEARIYDLVVRRFVAVFFPMAEFEETVRTTQVGPHAFRTTGKVLVVAGWRAVWGQEADAEEDRDKEGAATLPALGAADGAPPSAKVAEVEVRQDATKPPARYNEASLLGAMENAGKLVEDEALAEAMKERGLGTPATRAATIEGLLRQAYIERQGKELVPTAKAFKLERFLDANSLLLLADPQLTGEWEHRLREMERGKLTAEAFMRGIHDTTREMTERVKGLLEKGALTEKLEPEVLSPDGTAMLVDDRRYLSAETLAQGKKTVPKVLVYRELGGRPLTPEELRELLDKRRIGPFHDFRSLKSGRNYSGYIKLEEVNGQLKAALDLPPRDGDPDGEAFDPSWPELGTCPLSGLPVVQTPAAGYRVCPAKAREAGARKTFSLNAVMLQCAISPDDIRDLLGPKGRTAEKRFVSNRTKRPFNAWLVPDKSRGWWFAFPPRKGKPGKGKGKAAAEGGAEG